jgi:hypothetical protein
MQLLGSLENGYPDIVNYQQIQIQQQPPSIKYQNPDFRKQQPQKSMHDKIGPGRKDQ